MLFGHQSDDAKPAGIVTTAPADDVAMPGVNPLAVDPDTGVSLPTAPPPPPPTQPDDGEEPVSVLNQPTPASGPASEPTSPADEASAPPTITDITPGTGDSGSSYTHADTPLPPPASEPMPSDTNSDDSGAATSSVDTVDDIPATDDLLALKQQALSQLGPLVDQLDQTPEERFRTTMMLIQSTDDSSRIPEAYKAAQAITNEKVRAQALLDVINEINYFTQKQHDAEQPDQSATAI